MDQYTILPFKPLALFILKVWLTAALISGAVIGYIMYGVEGFVTYPGPSIRMIPVFVYLSLKFTLIPCLVLGYSSSRFMKRPIGTLKTKIYLTLISILSSTVLMFIWFLLDSSHLGLEWSTLYIWLSNTVALLFSVWLYKLSSYDTKGRHL